jgi:DNA adenine methylase
MMPDLKSPYPYFGGKSKVAELVSSRLGNVQNYVEPFFGSGAVLLARPHEPKVETVNDMDCYLTNFWRALAASPDEVAFHADNPVNECDLHARHRWLKTQGGFIEKMRTDPDYYDAKIAGWWVWGISAWIGDGWCRKESTQIPHLGDEGMGVHRGSIPHLGNEGRGGRPHLGRDQGTRAKFRTEGLYHYLGQLAARVRRVRVCCGDWSRVCGDSVTIFHGLTGVFLDPPYFSPDRADVYNHDSRSVPKDVEAWAISHGDDKRFRIALCGYEGDYAMPDTWECVAWKSAGGYANRLKDNANARRERIWFSPHCLSKKQPGLFD